ncbi:TPA: hypothetical protein ACF2DS_000154 [Clostridium perfringens]
MKNIKLIAKRDFEIIRNKKVIGKIQKDKEYIASYFEDTQEFFIKINGDEILVAEILDNQLKIDEDFKLK